MRPLMTETRANFARQRGLLSASMRLIRERHAWMMTVPTLFPSAHPHVLTWNLVIPQGQWELFGARASLATRVKSLARLWSVHLVFHNTNPNPLVEGPTLVLAPVHGKVRRPREAGPPLTATAPGSGSRS